MERAALHDLLAVLRLVDAGKVAITDKNRWPTPGTMGQIGQVLEGGDFYADEEAAELVGGTLAQLGDLSNLRCW